MKQYLKLPMLLLVTGSLCFAACKKDKVEDDDDTPSNPGTTVGAKTPAGPNVWLRCKVGGTQLEATTVQAFQENAGGLWRYHLGTEISGGKRFDIQVQNIQGGKVTAQTFDISTPSSQNSVSVQYNDGTVTWLSGSGMAPGTLIISKISGNATAGTFNFTVRNISANDSLVVTEGTYSTNNYGEI